MSVALRNGKPGAPAASFCALLSTTWLPPLPAKLCLPCAPRNRAPSAQKFVIAVVWSAWLCQRLRPVCASAVT